MQPLVFCPNLILFLKRGGGQKNQLLFKDQTPGHQVVTDNHQVIKVPL